MLTLPPARVRRWARGKQKLDQAEWKAATDCFLAIMAFMGDFPVKHGNDTLHVQVRTAGGRRSRRCVRRPR